MLAVTGGLLAEPGTWEMWVLLAIGAVSAIAVMFFTANLFGIPAPTWNRVAVVFLAALAVIPGAIIAARIHIVPMLRGSGPRTAAVAVAAVVALLAIVVPLQCRLQKAKYLQAFFNLLLSMAVAALLVGISRAGIQAARSGGSDVHRLRRHNVETETLTR